MPTADERTNAGEPAGREQQIDHRMMRVVMIGCCLAVPLVLIIIGGGGGPARTCRDGSPAPLRPPGPGTEGGRW